MKSLFLTAVLILNCCVGVSSAAKYTVCGDGSTGFSNYSDVVSLLAPGDIVEFCDGTYVQSEDVVVAGVTLCSLSGNPESCIINLGNNTVRMSGVSALQGLTVTGGYLGVLGLPYAQITIDTCRIVNNSGNYVVGGIRAFFGSLDIIASRVADNSATQIYSDSAGGITAQGCAVTMTDCVVSGNQSPADGGAIKVISGSLSATGCLFTGNKSSGGAIQCDAPMTMQSCTVAGNDSYGVELSVGYHVVSFDRTLMWGNCPGDLKTGGWGFSITCSQIHCTHYTSQIICSGQDPLFCDEIDCWAAPTSDGDFHLMESSPAVTAQCGTIGARGVACATIHIDTNTWGEIKSLYRP